MGHTQKDIAWLVVFLLDPRLYRIDERGVPGTVALDQLAGLLVDDDKVIVVIYDFQVAAIYG